MSIPSYTYKCSRCDFNAPGTLLTGHTVYDDGEHHIDCTYKAAWCCFCESITPLEVFTLDKSQYEKAILTVDRVVECTSSFWQNIFNALVPSRRKLVESELNDITLLLKYMELANQRSGDEKCLKCGSHDTRPFMSNSGLTEVLRNNFISSGSSPTGFMHPNCGGEIIAVGDDMRLNLVPSTNIYNMDGSFKEKVYR
ncbi:MAG: putative RNA-binding Zn-ribbon protein involved in translation (DUF1610 family) [Glaciecola sp.]|jgi:predicted RNA-binding Zn-ribbon protein involved in translation (DUF1610 family)